MNDPKFINFNTPDKLNLPGLLYESPGSKKIAILLHGNGSSSVFYGESKKRDLPGVLNGKGISYLAFNNRGAHIIKKLSVDFSRKDRKLYGCAYEIIKECVLDIEGALEYVKSLGYTEFYLIGVSTGANKICVYNHYKPENEFSKYALICGGDDAGGYYNLLGDKVFNDILVKSKEKIEKSGGEEISVELINFGEVLSYKGFCDIANPDGDYNCFPFLEALGKAKISKKPLFRYFKEIGKPSLVVYGENDEYAWGEIPKLVGILRTYKPEFKYEIIKDADHGFDGKEKELAESIGDWL